MQYHECVTKLLIEKKMTITFMESCTSGLLASMLTDTEGASEVFKGSLVTYSNEEKLRQGVDVKIIEAFGVYSKECARAMAFAAKGQLNTDIAVGITGSTGNVDPYNADSVTGEAYVCMVIEDEVYDERIVVDVSAMSREQIKRFYADRVYEMLYERIIKRG